AHLGRPGIVLAAGNAGERLLFAQLEAAAVAAVAGAKADADLDRRTGRPVARELCREGARERAAGEHLAVAGDEHAAAGGRVQYQGSEQRSEDEACGERAELRPRPARRGGALERNHLGGRPWRGSAPGGWSASRSAPP